MTVLFTAPVMRLVARMLLPSTKQPIIYARFSVLKRFKLTVMLEASGGQGPSLQETPLVSAHNVVMLSRMPSVHDVAAYILQKQGSMSTWKLQKLIYYSQAWSLVWEGEPLFAERIEAWANGPVVPDLYKKHRRQFSVDSWAEWGNPDNFSKDQRDTIDIVLADYGDLTGRQLSHLTHIERPWCEAREGLGPTDPSSCEITTVSMQAYYEALDADERVPPVGEIDWSKLEAS